MSRRIVPLTLTAIALLTGCASKREVVVVVPPPPPPAPVVVAMPSGGYPGMAIPTALADGSYPTPNRALTPAGTLWHFRAALNVAALACRGAQEQAMVAGYNAMLTTRKSLLASAQTRYAAEWRDGGGDWQDRYDDSMTRLYNFFSQSPARTAFCANAAQILRDAAAVPDEAMPAFAVERLAMLERPFTNFYRAYDAWRAQAARQMPASTTQQVIAVNAPSAMTAAAMTAAAPPPHLEVDPIALE